MERFQSTLENFSNEKRIASERVAVLVCPPLTRKRFEKEKKEPGFITQWFCRENEFVREIHARDWAQYEDEFVLYMYKSLLEIEDHTSATVIPDATYRYFKRVLKSRDYDVIFLMAHHIARKKESGWNNNEVFGSGKLEFADGGIPMKKVYEFLRKLDSEERKSFIAMICEASEFQEMNYNQGGIRSVASAFWKVEPRYGIEFVNYWIRFLNGKNTLSQAYHLAIDAFKNSLL